MDTAHKSDKQKKEHFDKPDELDKKISQLADMIRNAKHFTVFTGAGISTSTGIPDFRSGKDTVLKTGPGAWEKKALGLKDSTKHKSVSSLKAIPSKTHMALLQLERYGILKFLISQNTDGLHRRSGFNPSKLAELHGNTNMEKCLKCGKKYMRDFRTRNAKKVHDHKTGRKCDNDKCKGELIDTIINFGENLPEKDMDDGFTHAQFSDLCLALGSSLTVTPAADMPRIVGENKQLVIVNLQETPLDKISMRVNGLCDDVMEKLMEKLEIPIPEFTLKRYVQITKKAKDNVLVEGVDSDGTPYCLFRSVKIQQGQQPAVNIAQKPFNFTKINTQKINISLEFFCHYNEGIYNIKDYDLEKLQVGQHQTFLMEFDPINRKWVNFEDIKI